MSRIPTALARPRTRAVSSPFLPKMPPGTDERAHLEPPNRRDLAAVQASEERWRLLARAGTILASSLDLEETLASLARTMVPDLADFCVLFLVDDDGKLRSHAVAHADHGRDIRLWDLAEDYRPEDVPDSPLLRVVEEGEPLLVEDLRAEAQRNECYEMALSLAGDLLPDSMVVAPLTARGRALGVLILATQGSGRRYGPGDDSFVHELARRAGLAVDNARLYGEVVESGRRKDELLAMLAHELRNPLAPVVSSLELLRRLPPEATDRRSEVLDRAERQVDQLRKLVDDLLDVSRVTRGKIVLDRSPLDLREVVQRALATCQEELDLHRHHVVVDLPESPVRMDGDPVRLEQVICNLLHNAGRYTPAGGHVWVRLEESPAVGGPWAELTVEDDGLGMEPALVRRVFDLFAQGARSLARTEGGLGLGLPVVQRLVELHGGTVEASSPGRDRGSRFTVRLPLLQAEVAEALEPERPAAEPEAGLAQRPTRPRILVVEDNRDAAEALGELLSAFGYPVDVALDGPQGLALAQETHPDVVLLDLGLPGMDGYQVARELRANPWGAEALIVALTGYGQPSDVERTLASGFDHHLLKPVRIDRLRELLDVAMERRQDAG